MVWISIAIPPAIITRTRSATRDGINYIRNSVKVVVDAYTGDTDFYMSDPDDPVIKTWQRVFPAMFKPMSRCRRTCARTSAIRKIFS